MLDLLEERYGALVLRAALRGQGFEQFDPCRLIEGDETGATALVEPGKAAAKRALPFLRCLAQDEIDVLVDVRRLRAGRVRLRDDALGELRYCIELSVVQESGRPGLSMLQRNGRVTVDESRTDRYGVPLMKIDVGFGENEKKMMRHMYDTCEEILHTAGAEISPFRRDGHDPPGSSIHEHGTCRMGGDPKSSMLNAYNQMHEVDNVFVVDGSAFASASEKNPTLTILALSWRATDYLTDELRKGNL